MKRALLEALCLSVGLGLAFHTHSALVEAEDAKPKPAAHKPKKKRARASKPAEKPKREQTKPTATPPDGAIAAAQAASSSAGDKIVKEGDTSVKVMSFEGLGIEGRLKSPQLVYFVQRVQTEFARPVLPHRSFMPELQDSTRREPVR